MSRVDFLMSLGRYEVCPLAAELRQLEVAAAGGGRRSSSVGRGGSGVP